MAKIYETPLDIRRDEVKHEAQYQAVRERHGVLSALLGVTLTMSADTETARAAKGTTGFLNKVLLYTSMALGALGAFQTVDAYRSRKRAERELKELGPEQVIVPASVLVPQPTMMVHVHAPATVVPLTTTLADQREASQLQQPAQQQLG